MPISNYHALVGRQGRGVGAGYQGTRYDSPLSSFTSRMAMRPVAEPADEPAQKAVVETPTPVDAITPTPVDAMRERAFDRPAIGEGSGDVPSSVGEYSPANDFEAAIDAEAFGDYGLSGIAGKTGINTASAMMAGLPTSTAVKAGFLSAIGPQSMLGQVADLGKRGIAADQVKGSEYGDILGGYDVGAHRNISSLATEAYSPAPEDVDRYGAFEDALSETRARTAPLAPSLSPLSFGQVATKLGGFLTGRPTRTIFDDVVVPERYRSLLGGSVGAGPSDDGAYGPSEQATAEESAMAESLSKLGLHPSLYSELAVDVFQDIEKSYGTKAPSAVKTGYSRDSYGNLRDAYGNLASTHGGVFGYDSDLAGTSASPDSGPQSFGGGAVGATGPEGAREGRDSGGFFGGGGRGEDGRAGSGDGNGGGGSSGGDSSGGGRAGSDAGMSGQGDAGGLGGYGGYW